MKIVQEIFDSEYFVDQIISKKEIELLEEFMMLSIPCEIDGKVINLGLKMDLQYDSYEEDDELDF